MIFKSPLNKRKIKEKEQSLELVDKSLDSFRKLSLDLKSGTFSRRY